MCDGNDVVKAEIEKKEDAWKGVKLKKLYEG